MEFNYFYNEHITKSSVLNICPENEYRVLSPDTPFLSLLPKGVQKLVAKSDSVMLIVSGTEDGTTCAMFNINRVDERDAAIDQQPFMVGLLEEDSTTCGILVQHGSWQGRTIYPGQDFFNHLRASGIGTCYPISELPNSASGTIDGLHISSQRNAWSTVISGIEDLSAKNRGK